MTNMTDGSEQPKRRRRVKKLPQPVTETQVCTFDDIFPGFAAWYHEHYDADGKLKKPMPGLQPPQADA